MSRTMERNANWRGGKTKHPRYDCYNDMIRRCYSPGHPRFADYGGRGITVCEQWRDDFWTYVADIGERPSSAHSLDRIDNNEGYEPGNVRWATRAEQSRNRRRHGYETRSRNTKGQFT